MSTIWRNRIQYRTTYLGILLAALPHLSDGQVGSGSITGLVLDGTQAAVVGAKVIARNSQTGLVSSTVTNTSGSYNLPALAIGYEFSVESSGFKKYLRSEVTVQAARSERIDVVLDVGAVSESVSVLAQAPLLSAETSSVPTQVNKRMLDDVPLALTGAIRDPFTFIRLTPGASGTSFNNNIAGGRAFSSELFVDGSPVVFDVTLNVATTARPAYDMIAEFRVEAVLPPAEYGRTSSGVVTMVTRSGTNELHGNLVGLLHNSFLDARNYNARVPNVN